MAVDGLPLFGGAQLAIDATIVSALRGDGSARRGASVEDGVALTEGRNTSSQSWWVFAIGHHATGSCARQKLLVSQIARAKARKEPWGADGDTPALYDVVDRDFLHLGLAP